MKEIPVGFRDQGMRGLFEDEDDETCHLFRMGCCQTYTVTN